MFRSIILISTLLVSSESFASRASILIYGTGDAGGILAPNGQGGSLYRDDAYNIFYNPSYVNDFRNWAIIEKSNRADAIDVGSSAMGGGVGSWENFRYGAFFNRVGAINGSYTRPVRDDMRPVDLLLGGDHGVLQWGVGATYGNFKASDNIDSSKDLVARFGAQAFNIEPFLNAKLIGKDTVNGGVENSDVSFGVRYRWADWIPYAAFRSTKVGTIQTGQNFGLGVGRSYQMSERVALSGSLSTWRLLSVAEKRTAVPLELATDVLVTGWLTVRGGLTYRLISQTQNGSDADFTTARVGASIKAGPGELEWVLGSISPVAVADEPVTPGSEQVLGVAPGFFTAAAFAIRW